MIHSPDGEAAKAIRFGAPMLSHKSNSRSKSRDGVAGFNSHPGGVSYLLAVARSYLSQSLTRPLRTKDGGTLRTILDARSYMLHLSKARQRSAQWQRAAQLAKADVGAFSRQIELALVYDGKLDVTELPETRKQKKLVETHGHRV